MERNGSFGLRERDRKGRERERELWRERQERFRNEER